MIRDLFYIRKSKVKLFLGLFIYKLILDFVYVYLVSAEFSYNNFLVDLNIEKYIFSIICFFLISHIIPDENDKPSSIILLLHYIIMVLPIFTMYAFNDESSKYFIMVCICFSLECLLIRYLPDIHITKFKEAKVFFVAIVLATTIFVYLSMLRANGLPTLKALNILSVYDIRENVRYPFLMNYLVNWQAKAINPLMIAVSYKYKQKKPLIIFIGLQLLIYLITAHKAYLFIPIAIIVIMKIADREKILHIIANVASIGCVISYVLYKLDVTLLLASFFVRRLIFVPAKVKFNYYDFISNNEPLFFSEGLIGKLFNVEYPYDVRFVNLISEIYSNNPDSASNTGYLGSGYANLGFVGMLIYTIILVFILLLIDSLGSRLDKSMITGMVLFSMLSLNDSDMLTTLLTGGLLFLLLLLFLYASFDDETSDKISRVKENK